MPTSHEKSGHCAAMPMRTSLPHIMRAAIKAMAACKPLPHVIAASSLTYQSKPHVSLPHENRTSHNRTSIWLALRSR